MTVYADYSFYTGTYLSGKAAVISSALFPFYARKASAYIRQYTFDNIGETVPECVGLCCCELAEMIFTREMTPTAQGIASEKVGDVSVSYENAETSRQALPKQIKDIVYFWLGDTGLLYRGGGSC